MARWIALLLMILLISAAILREPQEIEQRLHGKVVLALADEDLSEVSVQIDGRQVILSGPENLLDQAVDIVQKIPGVHTVNTLVTAPPVIKKDIPDSEVTSTVQVIHPDEVYWPVKQEDTAPVESELLVTKVKQSIEVNGSVPNDQVKQGILAKIEQFIDIPEQLFNVTVNNLNFTPDWYLQGLPLIIPFVQWVDEGHLQYRGNRIWVDGVVPDEQARLAIETAIANIPSRFYIENRLRTGSD